MKEDNQMVSENNTQFFKADKLIGHLRDVQRVGIGRGPMKKIMLHVLLKGVELVLQ